MWNKIDSNLNNDHQHTTADIIDLDVSAKTNGNALQYDAAAGKFVSKPLPAGTGSGATNLDGLTDVDTSSKLPTEGDALTFQSGLWKPGAIASTQSNAEIPLFIETAEDGLNQMIHPKVLYFPNKWNGCSYWMASTPYPYAIASTENPHIHVSNDLVRWFPPTGLTNPIQPSPAAPAYNSDTHLVFNDDIGRLECWYREASDVGNFENIYRKVSTDGKTWSAPELLWTTTNVLHAVCPCVMYENGVYRIWAGYERAVIKYYESSDGANWNFISNVTGTYDWHFDFVRTDKGIEYVGGGNTDIYYAVSSDGINFTGRKKILSKGKFGNWDDATLYRPCLLKVGTTYNLLYTGQNSASYKGIGLCVSTRPDDITSLKGLSPGSAYSGTVPTRVFVGDKGRGQLIAASVKFGDTNNSITPNPNGNGTFNVVLNGVSRQMQPINDGTTAQRPTLYVPNGYQYFDTTLGKPIWRKGSSWVDANGTVV